MRSRTPKNVFQNLAALGRSRPRRTGLQSCERHSKTRSSEKEGVRMIGGVRGRAVALAVVIASLLGFFASAATTRAGGGTGGRVLTFGTSISLTGATAQEGKLTLNGYQLWARTLNSHGGINVGGLRYHVAVKYY